MTDKTIPQLPAGVALTGTEQLPAWQDGGTVNITSQAIANLGGGGSVTQVRVALSSAQLLACHDTPVEIVPAPGAGKVVQIISALYNLTFGTTQYVTGDSTIGLYYTPSSPTGLGGNATSVFTDSVDAFAPVVPNNSAFYEGTDVINTAIVFRSLSANMTDGDGTGSVTVAYITVTL